MCGISGIWAASGCWHPDGLVAAVSEMGEVLRHRGPDDGGTWCDASSGVALGHRRLSIIDLSGSGRQPMTGPSGTTHIVFNGEIYNFVELRNMLRAEGVQFRTATDTEVILSLYEKLGDECVQRLRGMFAFVIWDARKGRLLMARDRIGKKPLYYSAGRKRLVFASELKALRQVLPPDELQIDSTALNRFLTFGFISGPGTIYRGVDQLPPGSILVSTTPERHEVRSYWEPGTYAGHEHAPSVDEIEETLAEAVRIRLRSDVPVAAFLSGGIDSGLVTALAARTRVPLSTFTVGFEETSFDERPLARLVARRFGTDHHEVSISQDVERLLPTITKAYDQPFADASAIPSFSVAQVVSQHGFKVVLNGDGGDELFGGYRRALAAAWLSSLQRLADPAAVRSVARAALPLLASGSGHRSKLAFLRRFIRGVAADDVRRLLIWSTDSFTADERRDLGMAAYDEAGDGGGLTSFLPKGVAPSPLASMMTADLRWALPYGLLVKMDIATMAHGLETRSPLLDQELVDAQTAQSARGMWPGFTTKPVLRKLARKYLPRDVVVAPKRGFEPPVLQWLTGDLRAMRDDLLLSSDGLVATIADRARLERFLHRPPAGDRSRWAQQVWILLSLAAWDRFIVKESTGSVTSAMLATG